MTEEQAQAILDQAEVLHAKFWIVNQDRVGAIYKDGITRIVRAEVWLAMRAILIGRGFSAGDRQP